MLTAGHLREILNYDPETGVWKWIARTARCIHIGDVAGSMKGQGYWQIQIDGHNYFAHRLAWLYMTDEWPTCQIDHINLDRADNHWTNLREATASQNRANIRPQINNTSGFKGVSWKKRSNWWETQIEVNGKGIYLGHFDCPAAAHFAYIVAAEKYFGEFARVT